MSGFKDPIAPKEKKVGKRPFDFNKIPYDDRTRQQAGTNYGTGFKNPVGSFGESNKESAVPFGHVKTMNIYED